MLTVTKPINEFLGLITNLDESQVPLGGALKCANLVQRSIGRIQRVPGVSSATSAATDASTQIPLAFWATGLGAAGADQLIAIFEAAATVKVVNVTSGANMTGPALAATSFGKPWTFTFHNNKWMFAGGGNASIYQLDDAANYSAVTGSPSPPAGNVIKSYMNRLYVADISGSEGVAQYSDVLTTNFPAANLVNIKEIAGAITALAINTVSTDVQGIDTQLVLVKDKAIVVWDETKKDTVTQIVGSKALHTFQNTEAGLIFLGKKGKRPSVFWMPIGTTGEPKDIGEPLRDLLSGTTVLANEHLAVAALHDGFYKLFFPVGADTSSTKEVWLDTYLLSTEQKVRWYGSHSRGSFDFVVGSDNLDLFVRGNAVATKRYQENASYSSGFLDTSGNSLAVDLDMPLNVEPFNEEKSYDLLDLQIAKEANIAGNSITYEPYAEGTAQGTTSLSIYTAASGLTGISRITVPVKPAGRTGMTARYARLRLQHLLNMRFDILGGTVQYLRHEGSERVRKAVT